MRTLRCLSLVVAAMFLASPAFAALQADATWEVRTTGDNTNGSCYDTGGSGTDYSQQDAAELSLTDLATSGAGVTTLTSATGGFTDAMVDNCIYIASGTNFDVGYYEITVRTDTNTVTLDRTPSAAGAGSGGAGKVGGAAADPEQISGSIVAGQQIYIKAGTYTVTLATNTAGSSTAWVEWEGYNATRDDNPTGSDRPKFDCDGGANATALTSAVARNIFSNLWFDNCTGDGITDVGTNVYWNVRSSSHGGDGLDDSSANATTSYLVFSEMDTNTGWGCNRNAQTSNACTAIGTYLHDNGAGGLIAGGNRGNDCYGSVMEGNASHGNQHTGGYTMNCIAHSNTGAGIDGFSGVNELEQIINSVATDNGDDGFAGTAGNVVIFNYNAYNGNSGTGAENITAGANDQTGAPNFTDAANGDFTINSSSSLSGTGWPQSATAQGLTGDYQANIGLDQDDNAAAAAGSAGGAWGF